MGVHTSAFLLTNKITSVSICPSRWTSGYCACHWTHGLGGSNEAKDDRFLRPIKSIARLLSEGSKAICPMS
jgi:hypothetical protein